MRASASQRFTPRTRSCLARRLAHVEPVARKLVNLQLARSSLKIRGIPHHSPYARRRVPIPPTPPHLPAGFQVQGDNSPDPQGELQNVQPLENSVTKRSPG